MLNIQSAVRIVSLGVLATVTVVTSRSLSQQPPVNGMRPADIRAHAITDATVIPRPGEKIEHATIIIRDGVIQAVGPDVPVPADARVWPGEGRTVYAGLIDPSVLTHVQPNAEDVGSHWNPKVHPELSMVDYPLLAESQRKSMRELGFTVAAVYPDNDIFRGTGEIIGLGDSSDESPLYQDRAAMMMGFDYGGRWESAAYPGSLMGAIALIRQTFLDAQWNAECRKVYEEYPQGNEPPAPADALVALDRVINRKQPILFEVGDESNALRAAAIAREFNLDMVLLGSGTEFRRLNEIVALNMPIIVPLEFPDRPNVTTVHEAENTSLRELETWEQAPTNPRRLANAGATIALTTHKLKNKSKFGEAVRNAIKYGLTEDQALAAMTTTPAKLLGLDNVIGTIETGKLANLVVVEGSLFEKKSKIRDVWINGRRYEISKEDDIQLAGKGMLVTTLGHEFPAELDTTKSSFTIEMPAPAEAEDGDAENRPAEPAAANAADENENDDAKANDKKPEKPKTKKIKARKVVVTRDLVSAVVEGTPFGSGGYVQFTGVIAGDAYKGEGRLADGTPFQFNLNITEKKQKKDNDKNDGDTSVAAENGSNGEADENKPTSKVAGEWSVELQSDRFPRPMNLSLTLTSDDDQTVGATMNMRGDEMDLGEGTFNAATGELRIESSSFPGGAFTLLATIDGDSMTGTTSSARGDATITGRRGGGGGGGGAKGEKENEHFEMPPDQLVVPLGAFGLAEPPRQETVLLTHATIWTSGPAGVIKDGYLLIRGGKVEAVGPGSPPSVSGDAHTIDCTGKHVTPGMIDCHSHTGIDGGVNEWTQSDTAEVRVQDVIDPDDINWYRQLAGGTVACNQLHGSANPIGGQNSVVKFRWGSPASAFPIKDAIPGIKFALGENVTRTESRYPNSRMGVETFMRDAFDAAKSYEAEWKRYESLDSEVKERTMPPRRDLELDALVQILNGERIVHCHSYRQDEILTLIRLADSFGFQIGTFQHVLEGYKVADAIAKHGAGGSTFSDWWAYKVEVMDAIPYNGALMTKVGVVTSFNSDSSELARRFNTEAAKAVRYGGLAPDEALKLVTINPAKQLRIDKYCGSLEKGKDGDFVIWSGDPLSDYTRCEQTWIEGACYYSLEKNAELEKVAAAEHQRLVQKALADAHGAVENKEPAGKPTNQPEPGVDTRPTGQLAHMIERARAWMLEQVRQGKDPAEIHPGDCACDDHLQQLLQTQVQR